MGPNSLPVHLNNHHRATLSKIFQHPLTHNLEWRDVLSLLSALGSVEDTHDGKVSIRVGATHESKDRPKHQEVNSQEILALRKLLTNAGYAPRLR